MNNLSSIFKAYDIRAIYPDQINEEVAKKIGEAYATATQHKKVAVGRDVRDSGKSLTNKLTEALLNNGVDVVDIGVITTDQLYFAVGQYRLDGGISVTASHNPGEYNGFKFSEAGGAPITSEKLRDIRDKAASLTPIIAAQKGRLSELHIIDDYIEHVLGYIDPQSIKPLSVVANANFGAVGRGIDKLQDKLGFKLERLNWEEDGTFPKGPPNPLLPASREETMAKIKACRPDFGVAWDADADRCFFFTGEGTFIPSCYTVTLLAKEFLRKYPGSKIVRDAVTAWVIDETIKKAGGTPIQNRTGHTFIKARMRQEDAPFAGESSGHYYFRDSFYADNGIVPFLMIMEMVSKTGKTLSELVAPLMEKYKVSGEINFEVKEPAESLKLIESKFKDLGEVDKTDGLIVSTAQWRFSVRPSNTEPLFRLNAEAYDQKTLDAIVEKISALITV